MDLTCTGARMGQALVKTEALQGLAGARALGAFGVVVTAQSLRARGPTRFLKPSRAGLQPSLAPVTVAHCALKGDHRCLAGCSESTSSIHVALSSIRAALVAAHVRRAGALSYPPSLYCSCRGSTCTHISHRRSRGATPAQPGRTRALLAA